MPLFFVAPVVIASAASAAVLTPAVAAAASGAAEKEGSWETSADRHDHDCQTAAAPRDGPTRGRPKLCARSSARESPQGFEQRAGPGATLRTLGLEELSTQSPC